MGGRGGEIDTGALFREAHRGCWRADAPPLELEPREVLALMPLLIRTGSVGLVWPRLRHRAAELGATGAGLEAAYESQVEHNAQVEREIARVVGHLQGHGIDPVLIKGWAVSRLYPAGIVRPAGDIDLVVRDEDYERAKTLLAGSGISLHGDAVGHVIEEVATDGSGFGGIDLHHPSNCLNCPGEGFFERTELVRADDRDVKVLGLEDHLRVLVFHFLRHGGVRPLRLVDIAQLFESRSPEFDWDWLLRGPGREAEQVGVTLGLAHELLGAEIAGTPIADQAERLPNWLVPEVLRQWEYNQAALNSFGFLMELRAHPLSAVSGLQRRWSRPIEATMRTNAAFDDRPRLPIQWFDFSMRLIRFVAQKLPRQVATLAGRRR